MARKRDGERKPADEHVDDSAGTLADAISAHLELKKEHGADPDSVEQERQSALAPARRDREPEAELPPAPRAAPAPLEPARPDAGPPPEAVSETARPVEAVTPPEAEPPLATAPPAPSEPAPPERSLPEPPLPTEDTGNFEFDWNGEADEPLAEEASEAQPPAEDVLEQTPEFFEETPEYDRLWFEERSPRDFNF